jgi:hypothetical protein
MARFVASPMAGGSVANRFEGGFYFAPTGSQEQWSFRPISMQLRAYVGARVCTHDDRNGIEIPFHRSTLRKYVSKHDLHTMYFHQKQWSFRPTSMQLRVYIGARVCTHDDRNGIEIPFHRSIWRKYVSKHDRQSHKTAPDGAG